MRVLGVHEAPRHDVVFVELRNPASKPMRITKLEYKFAAAGATLSSGELEMVRDVPAESSIVVEVPLDGETPKQPLTLFGTVTAELDQIVRSFQVSAQIQPH
jgi:LEA14-like dessication related protein